MFLTRITRSMPVAGLWLVVSLVAVACDGGGNPTAPQASNVTVTAISPSAGWSAGGTTVTITGSGFASGATVQIGTATATNVTVVSATTLTATAPAHAAGPADVRVTVGSRTGTLAGGFTFVTPATGPNMPPSVGAIAVTPPRTNQPRTLASVGDRLTLTSNINDADTPLSGLTIQWTATPNVGTFSGSGGSVQWTAPAETTEPQTVTLRVTVVEQYFEDASGVPVLQEHHVTRSVNVKVHDSETEVSDMAVDFLTLFSDSSTSPEEVLHNFSQTCDNGNGYAHEYSDIVLNRQHIEIVSYTPGTPRNFEYRFRSARACTNKEGTPGDACVEVPWSWTDYVKADDVTRTISGTDFVTAVYEQAEWRLCHSRWTAINTLTGKPVQLDFNRTGIVKAPIIK